MGPVRMSSRASWVAKPNDSPYYIGLDRASEDPYYRVDNPDGVIQLGLSENRLCLDLIEKWVSENLMESMVGTDGGDLSISGIAAYQPFDGMTKLKVDSVIYTLIFPMAEKLRGVSEK
ncbi:probable aminotransferase ACS12 isoform X3 [Malus sylvestris]|uniref:probable aminotransferase ACS12 isoform X3 n=1 Tax=Malus sylvestris TaxID=3752 RepID=UPI0021ABE8E2|nr:probable aminotransferase ACS12 isoform X3 [Malus sylvestris]